MNLYFNKPRGARVEASQSLINWVPSFLLRSDSFDTSLPSREESHSLEISPPLEKALEEPDEVEHELLVRLSREHRDLAGLWDSHRFENKNWIPSTQPDSRTEIPSFKKSEDIQSEQPKTSEDIQSEQPKISEDVQSEQTKKLPVTEPVELSRSMIKEGLSYLDRCPETLNYSYTKLVLSKKGLNSINVLQYYKFIQYLDVSGNKLKTLNPLENMKYLKYLDASYNQLNTILDFKAPFFLTTVNFSHNRIKYLRDISEFWSIVDLNVSYNSIREICGLETLRYLNTLNLSHNEIQEIENIQELRLQYLYLQNNFIKYDASDEFKNPQFDTMHYLRFVNLSNNEIKSLNMFKNVVNLEILEVANNYVKTLLDVYYLRNLKYLTKLNLEGNPVINMKRYVEVCVSNLQNLVMLDNQKINFDFWQARMSQTIFKEDVIQQAYKQRLKLLLMEQINPPVMWNWLQPYDIPLGVIILVGPKGSNRAKLMKTFTKRCEGVILGVLHTTRPRNKYEVEGEDFYYISHEKFMAMLKNGEFLTFFETLGNFFGIAQTEFEKSLNSVVIFRGDLISALALKSKFFNAKLVLAVSSTEDRHVKTLQTFYSYTVVADTVRIVRSPDRARQQQEEQDKHLRDLIEKTVKSMLNTIVDKICLANSESFLSKLKSYAGSNDLFQMWLRGTTNIVENSEFFEPLKEIFLTFEARRELSHILALPETMHSKPRNIFKSKPENSELVNENKYAYMAKKYVSFAAVPETSSADLKLEETKDYILKCLKFLRESSNLDDLPDDEESKSGDYMKRIFDYFLKTRSQLLELHFSMPGLFRELIFPEQEEESMETLIRLAKDTYLQGQKYTKPIFNFKDDPHFQIITKSKIEQCFKDISCEMSVAQKQKDEFMEALNLHHTAITCTALKCQSDTNLCVRF